MIVMGCCVRMLRFFMNRFDVISRFIEGTVFPKKTHWHERVALQFLEACAEWKQLQQQQQQQQHHTSKQQPQQQQLEELSMPHT